MTITDNTGEDHRSCIDALIKQGSLNHYPGNEACIKDFETPEPHGGGEYCPDDGKGDGDGEEDDSEKGLMDGIVDGVGDLIGGGDDEDKKKEEEKEGEDKKKDDAGPSSDEPAGIVVGDDGEGEGKDQKDEEVDSFKIES